MKYVWMIAGLMVSAIVGVACVKSFAGPLNVDFTMFWAQRELAYPPPYLLIIRPLTYLPYGVAFTLWIVTTGALYVFASRDAKLPALGNPATAFNGMIGQNGFLTGAIMFLGLRALTERPALAGAILGVLIIKPHLALILPVAVVAARAWRAVPTALLSIVALSTLSVLVFGPGAYAEFLETSLKYRRYIEQGAWEWNELASIFALCRWLGLSASLSLGFHIATAIAAVTAVWFAWRQDWDGKIALSCAAALLMSPYLFTYDAVLLTLALGWLRQAKAVILWIMLVLPLVRVFTSADWPNSVPIAAIFAVAMIIFANRQTRLPVGNEKPNEIRASA